MSVTYEEIEARLSGVEGEATEALFALYEEASLPVSLWFHFACDCAERALARDEAAGVVFSPALRSLLDGRRRQLAGEEEETALTPLTIAARDAVHAAATHHQGQESAAAAADAGSDVIYAIRAAAWAVAAAGHAVPSEEEAAARRSESQWQVRHLLSLVRHHVA